MRNIFTTLLTVIALFWASNCTNNANNASNLLPPGAWRIAVTMPGGELPFQMEVSENKGEITAQLINGEERVAIDEIEFHENQVILQLPVFNSRIEATADGSTLKGTLTLTKRGGKLQVMPLVAVHNEAHRFFPEVEMPVSIDVSGRWRVTFMEEDSSTSQAVGEFSQDGSKLKGTFLTPTGDYRFLAGEVKDSVMYLSCFDGGHAFLFKAKMGNDGKLSGDFWSGTQWHETWTAIRDESAALPDAYSLTYLNEGYDKISFSFPDADSNIVSLEDNRFRGKVVILVIAGSWCPNCNDEARFLAPFYKKNRDNGLEIIGLMYEHFKDFPAAAQQVRRFKKKYHIEYELLVAGYSDKKDAAETLPMINHVLSYPTTIFIDRKGEVRKIHTGFTGPGTGYHYEKLTREFSEFTDLLLNE